MVVLCVRVLPCPDLRPCQGTEIERKRDRDKRQETERELTFAEGLQSRYAVKGVGCSKVTAMFVDLITLIIT